MLSLQGVFDEKIEKKQITFPWVIISLNSRLFGVSSKFVTSMELLPSVTEIPHSPRYMRGMVKSRGKMLPLIDTRIKLGFNSLVKDMKELSDLFQSKRDNYEVWVNELESAVKNKRPVQYNMSAIQAITSNWYDQFKTDNFAFQHLLKKFESPHMKMHDIAKELNSFIRDSEFAEAAQCVSTIRQTAINELRHLFDKASRMVLSETREIMLVVELENLEVALTVDVVTSVEYLKENSIQAIPLTTAESAFSSKIGKRINVEDENVIILDFSKIDIEGLNQVVGQKIVN